MAVCQSTVPRDLLTPDLAVKLRVLIADDEQLSRDRLKRFLAQEEGIELVAECANGLEALGAIREENPNLVFLDVLTPELDAFAILEALKDARLPAIILVTAHSHFALRAFEIDAVDCLLKPFDHVRFQTALGRARHRLDKATLPAHRSSLPAVTAAITPGIKPMLRVPVKSQRRISFIRITDIDWVMAADNYVELHVEARTHLLRTTISGLASRLPQNQFARISRSIVVNLDRIQEIQPKSHGDYSVILKTGLSLPGSRNYRHCLAALAALAGWV